MVAVDLMYKIEALIGEMNKRPEIVCNKLLTVWGRGWNDGAHIPLQEIWYKVLGIIVFFQLPVYTTITNPAACASNGSCGPSSAPSS
jgi:hypothetical protein